MANIKAAIGEFLNGRTFEIDGVEGTVTSGYFGGELYIHHVPTEKGKSSENGNKIALRLGSREWMTDLLRSENLVDYAMLQGFTYPAFLAM